MYLMLSRMAVTEHSGVGYIDVLFSEGDVVSQEEVDYKVRVAYKMPGSCTAYDLDAHRVVTFRQVTASKMIPEVEGRRDGMYTLNALLHVMFKLDASQLMVLMDDPMLLESKSAMILLKHLIKGVG